MLMNNLDPEVAERPEELVVYGGTDKAVRNWESFRAILGALQALDSSSPGEVLEQVNEALLARIPANMFVTCFYALLDPETGRLLYANAGHDLPFLCRRSGEDAEDLRARGIPLGLMPGMSFEVGEDSLREGDGVLFYSDGLVEAHGS